MKRNIFLFIGFLVGLSLIVYWPIFGMFFLQDEWLSLGHILVEGIRHPFAGVNFIQFVFGEDRSLARILGMIFFGYFRLNTFPVAVFSLFLHTVNSYLVFLLAKKLIKNTPTSFLAGIIFLVSSVASNTVLWFGTSIGTIPATTLILSACFTYFNFMEKGKSKFLFLTFFLLYISLFFKEVGVYFFILFPFASLLFKKTKTTNFFYIWWPFLVFFLAYLGVRITELKSVQSQQVLFLTGTSRHFVSTLAVRSVLYPLTSFSLQFIPSQSLLTFARFFTNIYYPFYSPEEFNLIVQTAVLDIFAVGLSLAFLSAVFQWIKIFGKVQRNYIIFLILSSLLSFLPYVVISKNFSYLESRYYYLSLVFGSIILAWLAGYFLRFRYLSIKLIVVTAILSFLSWHAFILTKDIKQEAIVSNERREFISQLKNIIPTLKENRTIFYITSDRDYYIPGNKVPFQGGMGYTLMVLYYDSGKIPAEFLAKDYLFVIGSEGYQKSGDLGFGYFSKLDSLKNAVKANNLSKNIIIGLYYNPKTGRLIDISPKVLSGFD